VKLVSFLGGFGRVEDGLVVPMGDDIVAYLVTGRVNEDRAVPLAELELRASIPRPGKIICVGLNYSDHAAETNTPVPDEPPLFGKYSNSVIAHHDPVIVPPVTQQPDYEAELAVVIGRVAKNVPAASALEYVAGYTCANDVSARDLQARNAQWTRGKAVDTFLPLGPWLVTADEISEPGNLSIRLLLNGEIMQDSNTGQMIWSVAELVAFISLTMTLEPGDVITTGTPPGVGIARMPTRFLEDGDEVTVEIERIGRLTNHVVRPFLAQTSATVT
jgi:2,4-diketo-3-deoxy-L-fuconate hydrolase